MRDELGALTTEPRPTGSTCTIPIGEQRGVRKRRETEEPDLSFLGGLGASLRQGLLRPCDELGIYSKTDTLRAMV